jgi:hypothetical protein
VEEVTFEEDFRAAIIEVAATRTFDVDDGPHCPGWDTNDTSSLIECALSQRLTWSGEIHHILPWGPGTGRRSASSAVGSQAIRAPKREVSFEEIPGV